MNHLLRKHASCLTKDDLPKRKSHFSSDDHNTQSYKFDYGPTIIRVGQSIAQANDADDLSALTPIPENQMLLQAPADRWETGACASTESPQMDSMNKENSSSSLGSNKAPQLPPRRAFESSPDDSQ